MYSIQLSLKKKQNQNKILAILFKTNFPSIKHLSNNTKDIFFIKNDPFLQDLESIVRSIEFLQDGHLSRI
jgi:hypothetical protein